MTDPLPPDDLLSGLRAGGEADDEGHFTIDLREARRKLGTFRLASPAHWLLPMVAHAVGARASKLNVSYDLAQWRLSHDGASLSRAELDRLMALDGGVMSPSLAHLSTAVDALLALGADVDVESANSRLRFEGETSRLDTINDDSPGVGIRVLGLSSHPPTIRGLLDRVVRPPDEERLLRETCRYAPLDLRLNDQRIPRDNTEAFAVRALRSSGGVQPTDPSPNFKSLPWDGGFDARLGFVYGRGALIFVVDGIAFSQDDRRFESLGMECIAWPQSLELDLSYGGIVRDAAWQAVVDRLASEVPRLVVDVAAQPERLSPRGLALLQGCLGGLASWFTVDVDLPKGPAVLRLLSHRTDLTSIDAAEARKLVARADVVAEYAALGRLEENVFEAWQNDGATYLRLLHEDIMDRLRTAGPSRALVDALHRTVIRHARSMQPELAMPFARQARTAAFALAEDPSLRARALDVEALALRCTQTLGEAQELHMRARALRTRSVSQARSDVLLAEVAMANRIVPRGKIIGLLRGARASFAAEGERSDFAETCVELAHCQWMAGDSAAVTSYEEAAVVFADANPQARIAREAMAAIFQRRLRPPLNSFLGALFDRFSKVLTSAQTPSHPDLRPQLEILEDYFLRDLYKAERLAELLGGQLLAVEGSAPFSTLWLITARRLVFAYRLADRLEEADALMARIRLAMPLWPLDPEAGIFSPRSG